MQESLLLGFIHLVVQHYSQGIVSTAKISRLAIITTCECLWGSHCYDACGRCEWTENLTNSQLFHGWLLVLGCKNCIATVLSFFGRNGHLIRIECREKWIQHILPIFKFLRVDW
jgi:hypothetical protein